MWYQDSNLNTPKVWGEIMDRDNVKALHQINVKCVSERERLRFQRDAALESRRMEEMKSVEYEPMRRGACDVPYTCPRQNFCFLEVEK